MAVEQRLRAMLSIFFDGATASKAESVSLSSGAAPRKTTVPSGSCRTQPAAGFGRLLQLVLADTNGGSRRTNSCEDKSLVGLYRMSTAKPPGSR